MRSPASPSSRSAPSSAAHAIKGPLATMIPELTGEPPSAGAVARHYGGLLERDGRRARRRGAVVAMPVLATSTVMRTRDDRLRLAREVLEFAAGVTR